MVERLTVPAWTVQTLYLKPLVISKFFSFIGNVHANIRTSDFVKPRDRDAWAPMLTPLVATRDEILSPNAQVLLHPNIITISTAFNWDMDVNKKFCYSKVNEADRIRVTEMERGFASQAVCPITINAFESAVSLTISFLSFRKCWLIFWKLKEQLKNGYKESDSGYIHLSSDVLGRYDFYLEISLNLTCINRNTVRMNDKDHKSFSIISVVPSEYQANLFEKIDLIFPGALRNIDTTSESAKDFFIALHLVWYNRYAKRVGYS